MMFRSFLLIGLLLVGWKIIAQTEQVKSEFISGHTWSLRTGFTQTKDAFNYGLVYHGAEVTGAWSWWRVKGRSILSYQGGLGLGMNGQVGPGLSVALHAANLAWSIRIQDGPWTVGGYTSADYRWQLYPLLQSGHMFWMTAFEIGPRASVVVPVRGRHLAVSLAVSLAGLTSRPAPSTETYFYSLAFSDFVKNAHRDLTFGMSDRFNHTRLAVSLVPKPGKRITFAYILEYLGYYPEPAFQYLQHALSLTWSPAKRTQS